MSEKEIRAILQSVCTELDRRVRKVVSSSVRKVVLPAALGAGVALSGGCDNGRTVDTHGDADIGVEEAGSNSDTAPDAPLQPPYMAPDPDFQPPRRDAAASDVTPVHPPYMAPDPDAFTDGFEPPPEPDYMAPEPDPTPVPLYDAPPP